MAKLTWLGEDELHTQPDGSPGAGPSFTFWQGVKFPKGEPVEVSDKTVIAKAKGNKFFEVTGAPGRPPKDKDGEQDKE